MSLSTLVSHVNLIDVDLMKPFQAGGLSISYSFRAQTYKTNRAIISCLPNFDTLIFWILSHTTDNTSWRTFPNFLYFPWHQILVAGCALNWRMRLFLCFLSTWCYSTRSCVNITSVWFWEMKKCFNFIINELLQFIATFWCDAFFDVLNCLFCQSLFPDSSFLPMMPSFISMSLITAREQTLWEMWGGTTQTIENVQESFKIKKVEVMMWWQHDVR